MSFVLRDGAEWQLGTSADVAWIRQGTVIDRTIQSSMPLVFDAYATVVVPDDGAELELQDRALVEILGEQAGEQPWWLAYLERGPGDDVVFPRAARVAVYEQEGYVLVQAGPSQAASWRARDSRPRRLPDVIFPADRSWLLSTLWDDDWTCIGGPASLIEWLLSHPDLEPYARQLYPGEDATPPGHVSI